MYFGRRYYDPTLGRWTTQDPLGTEAGPNLYAYVSNCPLTHFDMYGLFEWYPNFFGNDQNFFGSSSGVSTFTNACMEFGGSTWDSYTDPLKTINSLAGSQEDHWDSKSFITKAGNVAGLGLGALPLGRLGSVACRTGNFLFKGLGAISKAAPTINRGINVAKNSKFTAIKEIANSGKTVERVAEVAKDVGLARGVESAGKVVSNVAKTGARNRFTPDPLAKGAHSVLRRDPVSRKISHYETFKPQTNPYNPNPWESMKRLDNSGMNQSHFNKFLKKEIYEPHVHDPTFPGKVRPAEFWEIPR